MYTQNQTFAAHSVYDSIIPLTSVASGSEIQTMCNTTIMVFLLEERRGSGFSDPDRRHQVTLKSTDGSDQQRGEDEPRSL